MASDKDDSLQSISVQLNGENYSYWSYVMKNFFIGKDMWGYIDGTSVKPTNIMDAKYAETLKIWNKSNSKVVTWINNSVSQSIGMQLAKYDTAQEIWDHLKRLYEQSNFAKRYKLESEIRDLKQNNMTIHEFYSAMTNLWDQLALMESPELKVVKAYTDHREEQRLVQLLMALRDDFEGLRGAILHRVPLPNVDSVVNELLAEETRLKSHSYSISTHQSVFATHKGKLQGRVVLGNDECAFCKEKGHWKAQCPKLLLRSNSKNVMTPTSNVVAATSSYPSEATSQISDLAEQLQKLLATQPQAMTASFVKSLNPSDIPGPTFQEADWDMP
jgi:plasmid maintenance system antidote protein VapI